MASVAVDATGVPQQEAAGAQAESRMANVAVLDNPVPEDRARWADPAAEQAPPWQARSVASLGRRAEVGATVRQHGGEVGIEQAERWIALVAERESKPPLRWYEDHERGLTRESTET